MPAPSDLEIRDVTEADLTEVSRRAAELVRLHHRWDSKRFMLVEPLEAGYRRFLSSQLGQPGVVLLLALRRGACVGYLYGALEDRDWPSLRDACGAIHDVYVDADQRRHGVASALMAAALERLKALGAPRVVLGSAQANAEGQKLFEKLGFRRTMVEFTREL